MGNGADQDVEIEEGGFDADRERRKQEIKRSLIELTKPENIHLTVQMLSKSSTGREMVARYLVETVTENRTDRLLGRVLDEIDLPWWLPEGVIRRILDNQLPQAVVTPVIRLIYPEFGQNLDPYDYLVS